MSSIDKYGNEYWNLCLIRKIPLVNSKYHAVLVIKLSDNYLRTRIGSEQYAAMVSVDNSPIFFSSDRSAYGEMQVVPINYDENYYQYAGDVVIDGKMNFVDVSTLHMYQSDSKVYICTTNDQAYGNIQSIIYTCFVIIAVAIVLPGVIIHFFADYFTNRILSLRQAMHQVSNEDYEIVSATGTLSMDGCHIHVSLSDEDLNTIGGHLKDNCLVNVTAEIVLGEFDDFIFTREYDESTGYKELVIEERKDD